MFLKILYYAFFLFLFSQKKKKHFPKHFNKHTKNLWAVDHNAEIIRRMEGYCKANVN
jgi:hypothetical protein